MTTGERIKAARKKAGLTQAQLAEKLGVPFQSISQWERDTRKPKMETLAKIAEALGTSVSELYDVSDSPLMKALRNSMDQIANSAQGAASAAMRPLLYGNDVVSSEEDADPEPQHTDTETKLLSAFSRLNEEGQQKAVERVEELAEIPKYQK